MKISFFLTVITSNIKGKNTISKMKNKIIKLWIKMNKENNDIRPKKIEKYLKNDKQTMKRRKNHKKININNVILRKIKFHEDKDYLYKLLYKHMKIEQIKYNTENNMNISSKENLKNNKYLSNMDYLIDINQWFRFLEQTFTNDSNKSSNFFNTMMNGFLNIERIKSGELKLNLKITKNLKDMISTINAKKINKSLIMMTNIIEILSINQKPDETKRDNTDIIDMKENIDKDIGFDDIYEKANIEYNFYPGDVKNKSIIYIITYVKEKIQYLIENIDKKTMIMDKGEKITQKIEGLKQEMKINFVSLLSREEKINLMNCMRYLIEKLRIIKISLNIYNNVSIVEDTNEENVRNNKMKNLVQSSVYDQPRNISYGY